MIKIFCIYKNKCVFSFVLGMFYMFLCCDLLQEEEKKFFNRLNVKTLLLVAAGKCGLIMGETMY